MFVFVCYNLNDVVSLLSSLCWNVMNCLFGCCVIVRLSIGLVILVCMFVSFLMIVSL